MSTVKGRPRPVMRHSSYTGGSFIKEHQQYNPPESSDQNKPDGVAAVAGGGRRGSGPAAIPTANAANAANAAPAAPPHPDMLLGRGPSRIKDSGIVHAMSHRLCQRGPGDPERLVATLFYKAQNPRHPHVHPDAPPFVHNQHHHYGAATAADAAAAAHGNPMAQAQVLSTLPSLLPVAPSLAAGAAPTVDLAKFPLEPPAPEPEPLDHLYGPYVSQLCLAHLLQTLDELQKPWRAPTTSSHRCLDAPAQPRVMEVMFAPPPDPRYLSFDELRRHERVWRFEREWNVDLVFQRDDVWRRHRRLVVFDMDSTLIQQEMIDEIAKVTGFQKQVAEITSKALNGELDFTASLRQRVALLRGVPADIFERLKLIIKFTPGAVELCRALKRLGCKLAVLSGGFTPLVEWLATQLGIDYAFANNLVVSDDGTFLTGELGGTIVDGERKVALMEGIASTENIALQQVVAIGDGANDVPMLQRAGLGVAFNAKPLVQLEAPARLNTTSLLDVLYLFGLTKEEQMALLDE